MTRIFLIRHAEAEGNLYRHAHGHYDGLVTGRGYIQIGKLESRFKDEKIDVVYSSDLTRTQVTATAITKARGLSAITDKALREVNMGDWEDMAWGDIEYFHKEMSSNFGFDPARWSVSGSESYEDVISRMTAFITQAAQRHDGQTIAIFSHGFAIRSFFCRLMGFASHESINVKYCDNTAVALLLYEDGKFTIEYQSDNSHLKNDDSTFAHQKWWRDDNKAWVTENVRCALLDERRDLKILESFKSELGERPHAEMEYAAFLSEEPVGLLGISANDSSMGELKCIYLLPEFRKKSLAVQLLGKAVSEFRNRKLELMTVKAPRHNPVVKLCKKYGFQEASEIGLNLILEKNIRNW